VSARELTDEQRRAIESRDGSFALAANAGTGKTSVLVERFVRSVRQDGIAADRIVAITFTDRAAGELRTRVRDGLIAQSDRAAAYDSGAAWISTFHGFCARVLRAHPLLSGLAGDFVVLDDATTSALRERAFELALVDWIGADEALDLAAAFGHDQLRAAIFEVFDESRSRGEISPRLPLPRPHGDARLARARFGGARDDVAAELAEAKETASVAAALERLDRAAALLTADARAATPQLLGELCLGRGGNALKTAAADAYEAAREAYATVLADELGALAVSLLGELLESFSGHFTALKRARGAADFDDLELEALELLRGHDEVASAWRERFERLMVDELQDTNARQMAILALLDRDNLFTVGDSFQSIYAFRHADVELFRKRFDALDARGRAGVLAANFRSRAVILDGVNAVFAPLFASSFTPLTAGRDDAASGSPLELLISDTEGWDAMEDVLGPELAPAPLWRRAEARLLAQRIGELIDAGEARAQDIVVLLRAATDISVYESAIADLGYITLAGAGDGFYQRPEVADLAAYVRTLANPLDDLALYGVLASPLCGASANDLVELALVAREASLAPWQALKSGLVENAPMVPFAARLAAARREAAAAPLGEIITRACADHGYDAYLCQLHSPERRLGNVHKLVRLARDFERREGRDLRRFADALARGALGALREPEAPPPAGDAIRLMTIHRAKGLEFPVVCLADLGRAPNNAQPSLLSEDGRVGLRLPVIGSDSLRTLDYEELAARRRAEKAAEEQRIFYVAMTRARERLILSGAAKFDSWSEGSALAWIGPALVPDLLARTAHGDRGVELVGGAGGAPVRLTLSTAARLGEVLARSSSRLAGVGEPAAAVGDGPGPGAEASPEPATARVSYTSLAEYERCGYRYYLQRVIGLSDVEAPAEQHGGGFAASARGVLVHALLEQLDFASPAAPTGEALSAAAAQAGGERHHAGELAEVASLVGAFAASPLCVRLASASDVRREAPFAFTLEGRELLRGFFDVAGVEADGTLLVVDYKTDQLADGEDLATRVERDYAVQRLVYALAALHTGAPRIEIAHCFLRRPHETPAAVYRVDDRPRLEAELRARLAPLRSGRFAVARDPHRELCASCPGRARLCSYGEAMTLREGAASGSFERSLESP
jgi:ATP-dependent exoDNAse (exonuclease V) beta subunit